VECLHGARDVAEDESSIIEAHLQTVDDGLVNDGILQDRLNRI
jgi:hypothetical protein